VTFLRSIQGRVITLKKSTNKKSKAPAKKTKTPAKKPAAKKTTANVSAEASHMEMMQDYVDFMDSNGLVEIELQSQDLTVRLRKAEGVSAPVYASAPAAASAPAPRAETKVEKVEKAKNVQVVKSPFVGTFYRASGPNQEPFAEEGKVVSVGDTLCIVEAMKLMNEIESDARGRILRILVKNGTPVEFGEPLFEIEAL
jgi:acetyl-CoA carboxylase biotin carboxyl carrier protein